MTRQTISLVLTILIGVKAECGPECNKAYFNERLLALLDHVLKIIKDSNYRDVIAMYFDHYKYKTKTRDHRIFEERVIRVEVRDHKMLFFLKTDQSELWLGSIGCYTFWR